MFRHFRPASVLVLALSITLTACRHDAADDPRIQAPLVRVAVVQSAEAAARSFTGVVAARVQSDLGFRVAGKVSERLVDAGHVVRRGQVLMRIDPIDLRLAASAQQESVAAARAKASQTAQDEARYRNLRGTGAVSVSMYDQAKAAADTALAELKAAQAQAELARNANRYAELIADADGVVVETLAEPGQVVVPGQAVVRVAHAGQREAIVQLPETLRPLIGSSGLAALFGKSDMGAPTVLRQLSESADRLTRTYEARYVLQGDLANAPLGATVTIRVGDQTPSKGNVLSVPIGALFDAGKGPGVWIIDGSPESVTWRPVAVDRIEDDSARVSGEIKQGDRIVALGAHLLREGEAVRLPGNATAASEGDHR